MIDDTAARVGSQAVRESNYGDSLAALTSVPSAKTTPVKLHLKLLSQNLFSALYSVISGARV